MLGIGCKDTTSFMKSTKMSGFYYVETECKKICPVCAAVDYGNGASSLLKPSWRVLAGVLFAIVVSHFLLD